ncbi:MAG: preprotein translocase subunit SecE [Candidatus Aenigmatarchaeota archaeon]
MIKRIFNFLKRTFFILKEVRKPTTKETFNFFLKVLYFSFVFGLIGFIIYLILILIA